MTKNEAAYRWYLGLNKYPTALVKKLMTHGDKIVEVTPFTIGEYIKINGKVAKVVEIEEHKYAGDVLTVEYQDGKNYPYGTVAASAAKHIFKTVLPKPEFGTMYSFSSSHDRDALADRHHHLNMPFARAMAEMGIRIYRESELGYIFGEDRYLQEQRHFNGFIWHELYALLDLHWHDRDSAKVEQKEENAPVEQGKG